MHGEGVTLLLLTLTSLSVLFTKLNWLINYLNFILLRKRNFACCVFDKIDFADTYR